MVTFVATAPDRPKATQMAQIDKLVRGTQFSLSWGDPARNQPALTLCFNGPREDADEAVIEAFRKIVE